jgi:hypothetical protein
MNSYADNLQNGSKENSHLTVKKKLISSGWILIALVWFQKLLISVEIDFC